MRDQVFGFRRLGRRSDTLSGGPLASPLMIGIGPRAFDGVPCVAPERWIATFAPQARMKHADCLLALVGICTNQICDYA